MRYERIQSGGIINDIVVLLLSVIVIGIFFVNLAIYYIRKNPIEALEVIIIFVVVCWLVVVGVEKTLEYLGRGTSSWILEVIREVKGNSPTSSRKIEEKEIYSADPQHVRDAIDILVSFGLKRPEASLKVHSIVMNSPLEEVDTIQKIVKKSLIP